MHCGMQASQNLRSHRLRNLCKFSPVSYRSLTHAGLYSGMHNMVVLSIVTHISTDQNTARAEKQAQPKATLACISDSYPLSTVHIRRVATRTSCNGAIKWHWNRLSYIAEVREISLER